MEGVSTAQENVAPVETLTQADLTASQLLPLEQWDFDWDGSEAAAVLPKGWRACGDR